MIFLLGQLVHLAELIHVQLTNEGRKVFVPEVMWQDLFLQFLARLDEDFRVSMPTDELGVLLALNTGIFTSRI